ncbi:Rep family protein, partial [Staphylococcus epidermidis]|uniref:Rep family protein n=1 Tax=Staphylococcus epidermidis TaxID=1282 RepID=UPI0030C0CDC6
KQVLEVSERLNSPIPQKSKSTGGSIRYMIHIDSPDKVQYKKSDIEVYGNIDIDQYFIITSTERYDLILEMIDFVRENEIDEIQDLI